MIMQNLKKRFAEKKKKGFTLVETLVAITVLMLSIAAPLTIAATALFSAYYARDEITASFTDGWRVDSLEPATIEITTDPAGIRAWLLAATRT